jgi:SAM-dependent methyltransferase
MRSRRDPYEVFSLVYDQDVHLDVPRAFFRTLRPLVRAARHGPPVLDLGCGSGLLTARIAAAGAQVIGVDGSRPMLRRARARCAPHAGRVKLLARDLAALRLPPVHALAVACHDVLNHLPSEASLRRVLGSVRSALAPGGVFVFDALTDWAFETYWPDNTHRLAGPHGDLWLECDWDPARRRGTAHLVAYAKDGRGRYARHETTLHEYAWSDRALLRALRAAGFAEVFRRPWSPFADQAAEGRLERALWCARAPGAGAGVPSARLRALGFRPLAPRGRASGALSASRRSRPPARPTSRA